MQSINMFGPVTTHTGYGNHLLNITAALSDYAAISLTPRTSIDISGFHRVDAIETCLRRPFNYDAPSINIWFPDQMQGFHGAARVGYPVFECNVVPDSWIPHLEELDRILVPSEWAAEVLKNALSDMACVEVVPEGYDPAVFNARPESVPRAMMIRPRPWILSIGKWEARKGQIELITAIDQLPDDQNLTLFGFWDNAWDENWRYRFASYATSLGWEADGWTARKNGKVIVICERVKQHKVLASWMKAADLGVFPHRAEGWGLPILETMACGTPVVVSDWTGSTEFTRDMPGVYPLREYHTECVGDPVFWPQGGPGTWQVPQPEDIAHQIQAALKCSVEMRAQLAVACEQFTWSESALKILEIVE